MEQDGPKPAESGEQQPEQKPKTRRTVQKNGPWEWNWHPAEPQPIRSVSPADLSTEQRERLESSVGNLSSSSRSGQSEKPES